MAACGSSSSATTDTKATAPVTSVPVRAVTRSGVLAGMFVKDFRAGFPKMAKGVPDAMLADHAVASCNLISTEDLSRTDAIAATSKRFTINGIKPNDDTSVNILKLVTKDACSDRKVALDKLV
jgi:hypothetical protein